MEKIITNMGKLGLAKTSQNLEPDDSVEREQSLIDRYEEQRRREREEWAKSRMGELLGGEFAEQNYTFEKYKVVPTTRAAFEYAQNFDPRKDSVYFWGWCGSGKDHLAKAMVRVHFLRGVSARILTPRMLVRSLRGLEGSAESREIRDYVDVGILYLSEIGLGADTQYAVATLCEIIDRRHDKGKKGMIFTSNLSPMGLAEKLDDDRLRSRIEGYCRVVQIAPRDGKGKEIDWRSKNNDE